ncbi:MAG: hypothetical protein HND58_17420 [Planctomycetota bacterium]|nr:MAG: hypothetical protein HND58_17420 [Planctomycetota bacterium]
MVDAHPENDGDALLAGAGAVSVMAAAVIGLVCPAAAAGLAIGAGATDIISAVKGRRQQESARRAACLIRALHTRLKDLEERVAEAEHELLSAQHQDAFFGMFEAALEDDERAKLPFYEGAIEWLVRERPSPVKISMTRETLRRASYADLYLFRQFAANLEPSWAIMLNAFGIGRQAAVYRMAAVGLIDEAVLPADRTGSRAGAILVAYTRLGPLQTLEDYARELGLLRDNRV